MISRRVSWPRGLAAGALSLALVGGTAATAGGQWVAEAAAGGVSLEAAGAAATSSSALASIRYDGRQWFHLSGGIPLGSEGLPWAASGAGARPSTGVGPLELGLHVAGQVHGYRVPATQQTGGGLVADALPFVGVTLGGARLEGRSGIAHYSSRFAGETVSRTGHDNLLLAEFRPDPRLKVSGQGRVFRAEENDYPYLGASAEVSTGDVGVWAFAGRWTAAVLPDAAWGAGAVVRVAGPYFLRASYQQEPMDPLFWNETRRFWSVGVGRRMQRSVVPPITVPVLPEIARGGVVFRIPAALQPEPPSVAGDFNGWTPVEMRRVGADWVVTLPVPPGVHHYAFRSADGRWFVPDSFENTVDDGFGGTNAVLVVPAPGSR